MDKSVPVAPETDAYLARQRKLKFYVTIKEKARARWLHLPGGSTDLEAAMETARSNLAANFEVGVFVEGPTGGFLYWTSRMPDLFNSLVLREGYA